MGKKLQILSPLQRNLRIFLGNYIPEARGRPRIDNLFDSKLSNDKMKSLEIHFSEEEINAAVFYMKNDKSPRLDDFSSYFYQSCWA